MTLMDATKFLLATGCLLVSASAAPAAGRNIALESLGGANAPFARAALVYLADPGDYARSKGIAKVDVPTKGTYCVKLKKNGKIADVRKTVPVATAGAQGTYDLEALVLVATTSDDCPKGKYWLTVTTLQYDNIAAEWENTDDVSFNLIVP